MNLFCFSLEGSMDSLYEAVQNSGDGPTLPVPSRSSSRSCSRSCSPAVQLDDNAKWRGSGRSISMEISQMQGGISKKKTKRTHISKSASGIEALDNHGSNTAAWQPSRTREDLSHVANGQNEELAKAKHRVEAKVGKGGRHPGTKKKEKSMPRQTGSYEGWKPGQEWPPGMQRDGSVHANRVATEPRPAVKRGQKAGKKTGGKSGKEGSKKSHNSTVHAPPGPVTAPHLDISYRSDRRPYLGKASTLPAQENYTPGRGSDMSILSGGATLPSHNHHHQRLSNPAESSPVWTDAKHTCRRPLTEYRLYSQDLPLPRDQDWEGKAALAMAKDERSKPDPKSQVSPMMPRSITDVDLSEPNRTTSFGRFETHRHQQPSPAKLEEGTTALEEAETLEQHKSVGLAKKMKVISLTMRRKMGKKHAKSFSEEMGNDGDRDPEAEAAAGVPAEKEHAKTNNSLESLNSGQSSSSGVTSESNSSSQRDSLRLEEDGSYHGQFCSRARVHTDFVPSPYDTDSLKLKVGDIISIISKPPMGIWTGMLNNKVGNFKFIYVEVLVEKEKEEETPKIRQQKLCRRPRPKTLLELLECLHLEEYASALLLNGYQTVEDLMHLQEKHLIELNVKDPEHRHKLLTAAEYRYTGDDVRDGEEPKSSDGPQEEDSDCPRDSGCFIPSECSETHIKEDGEPLTHSAET